MRKPSMIWFFILLIPVVSMAQGNSFNFQGRLNDGTNPANGRYDLTFRLFDAIVGGNPLGQLVSKPNTVLINGVFSITLDMGPGFSNPNSTFIEISVKPAGSSNAYTILGPRQQLTVVPFAVRAANATNADTSTLAINAQHSVDAQIAVNATNAVTATNSLSLGGVPPAGWARLNVQNTGDVLLTGRLQITGEATQSLTSNGLVKAMLVVGIGGQILRCYNGTTGSSNGNCGFTVSTPLSGVYRINYNFLVGDRFVSVTPQYDNGDIRFRRNNGANYRIFDSTSIEVFTFISEDSENTFPINEFTIVMF